MTLPNKNPKEDKQQTDPRMWRKLSVAIEKKKSQLAEFLGRASEKLSSNEKKLALLFFGIVMGGISLTLIVRPFRNSPENTYGFSRELHEPITSIPIQPSDSVFSQGDYQLLIGYKHTLDSLKQHDPATYHELLKGREGLLDSINFLIRLYQ